VRPISIGITTRDRIASLRACLASILATLGTDHDVIVFDDGSAVPVEGQLDADAARLGVRVIRDDAGPGYIVGRNRMVRAARHDVVLLLDDDAFVLSAGAVESAATVLEADPRAAAVAFAQAERDGKPWPEAMQPGRGRAASIVPSFIGFAHLLRRDVFLALGGYRESFVVYGEEKEFCRRLLAAGHHVVYLPDALVAHVQDPASRDARRHTRYTIRNDCLMSLYNDPWPMVACALPLQLWRYRRRRAGLPGGDPGGVRWLFDELRRAWPGVRRARRPSSWRTVRRWRELRGGRPYLGAHDG
jgi:GT2 family glycosyltransferase